MMTFESSRDAIQVCLSELANPNRGEDLMFMVLCSMKTVSERRQFVRTWLSSGAIDDEQAIVMIEFAVAPLLDEKTYE